MRKRLFILCLALTAVCASTMAQTKYGIYVGGVEVTSANCSNVTGTNIKALSATVNGGKPSVVFEPSKNTLTLWNVKVDGTGSNSDVISIYNKSYKLGDELIVVLKGRSSFTATDQAAIRIEKPTRIVGETGKIKLATTVTGGNADAVFVKGATLTLSGVKLTITSESSCFESYNSSKLVIENSTITATCTKRKDNDDYALKNFDHLTVNNSSVMLKGFRADPDKSRSYECRSEYGLRDVVTRGEGVFWETLYGKKEYNSDYELSVEYYMGVPINSTNFPDPNFMEYIKLDAYNPFTMYIGSDGWLNRDELRNTTVLYLGSKEIEDLTGIEYFEGLEELQCGKNKLTSLDLSKNKKLKKVNIAGNQIKGAEMDALINSLPKLTNGGVFIVNEDNYFPDNEITPEQVKAANDKGWLVQKTSSGTISTYYGQTKIAINSENFPDAKFREYVSSKDFDKDEDGYLSDKEISMTKRIEVLTKGISNLKGIEHFTELQILDCSYNRKLTSLDLSKNTLLSYLFCRGCGLTSLDVTKNKNLVELSCYGNKINGTNMTNLVNSLNTRPASSIGVFRVIWEGESPDNTITDAQVKIATDKGWTVQVHSNNEWVDYAEAELRVALNSKNFPDANFLAFVSRKYIDKNEDSYLSKDEIMAVTDLYIDSQGISDLTGIEHFVALKFLDCFSNPLTKLDLSTNTALKYVDCHDCNLTTLNVSGYKELEVLYCSSNEMTSLNASNCPKLNTVHCNYNKLTSLDVTNSTQLEDLDCEYNMLTSLDVSSNTALSSLDCFHNHLTWLNVQNNTALEYLYCQLNDIGIDEMASLVGSLPTRANNDGKLRVIDNGDSRVEFNRITPKQVLEAKNKGWSVLEKSGNTWVDYNGVGDIDGNGQVDQDDLDRLVQVVMSGVSNYDEWIRCNLKNDSRINAADVVILVDILNWKK